jgi:hypothetical protein
MFGIIRLGVTLRILWYITQGYSCWSYLSRLIQVIEGAALCLVALGKLSLIFKISNLLAVREEAILSRWETKVISKSLVVIAPECHHIVSI